MGLGGQAGALSQLGAFDMGSLQNLLNVRACAAPWEARAGVSTRRQPDQHCGDRACAQAPPDSLPPLQDPSLRDMAQQLAGDPAFRSLSAGAGPGGAQMVRLARRAETSAR